jgi:hypothetical protein
MRAAAALSGIILAGLMATALAAPREPSAFARSADAVCARALADSAQLQRQRATSSTVVAELIGRADLARRQVAELRRLPASRAEEQHKARLVASFDQVADVMSEYARATRRGDRETRRSLAVPGGPGERAGRAAREAAAALGLDHCVGPT